MTGFTKTTWPRRRFVLTITGAAISLAGSGALAQSMDHSHAHGADGTGHDEVHMPGLRGLDASAEESNEIGFLFSNFRKIDREVTELPDGIKTWTYSSDPDVMAAIASHVSGMINRVEEGRDPKILIQSPTLDILFARNATLVTEVEISEEGVFVTQRSDDPEVVAGLQTHAGEVTDMADRGMQAVHEMMMERAAAKG